jgi:hypothetical protein
VTNRRTPAKRPTASKTWKPGRSRSELVKAVGAASGVVIVTALLIFVMKPGDSGGSSGTVPATTQTVPATTATTTGQVPAGSTPSQP